MRMSPSLPQPVLHAGAAPRGAMQDRVSPEGFVTLTLFTCLVLQRFAIPVGDLAISVATPILLGAAAWGLGAGWLVIDRRRMALFLGLIAVAALSTILRLAVPVGIAPRTSLSSLLHWLVLTSFAVLAFRETMPERRFFGMVNSWLALIAIAGIAQFALQFAGISVFGFTGLLPDRLLLEHLYVTDQVLAWGASLKRANGFFLLEPSIFAQFMAVALMIEALCFRRALWFGLFTAGMLVSVSGTGFLVLAGFGVALAIGAGLRGVAMVVLMAMGAALALGLTSLALPDVAETLLLRSGEFSQPGTSGHERFVTPFMMMRDVFHAAPWAAFAGIGPGTSEFLELPYRYWVNTPAKLVTEYGLVGFGLYLALIVSAQRSAVQRILVLPVLVLLLLTGGYHQAAPLLFPMLLLITVARLDEARPERRA